ncbi:RdgB/HAM1 family non-canonical purine NTP pyrophosphatase [Devosia rhizoryzae]|uniref:dITP/XTP pyrophosphatase n=1 Tax=Devosia rhizoryzae TaxID=2774137 RepID=A0ABX7C795_9HYPH|nr:RdgB/HAM1 family non-canonical purine NTP pyrophosphatase [Devosia rhizoryzae]QQR39069.1 RdgB/HAM1 family non-canonical purine NTP pyrophosphatase [Devosia rhizoryzae]
MTLPRLKPGTRLCIATHNAGKLAEFRELFVPFGLELVSAGELGLLEPEETGTTFAENARTKAHAAAKGANMLALSDDSGICVDALNGEPGVYTADWAGVPRDFGRAMKRVEDALQAIGANSPSQRRASFNATLCLAHPDGRDVLYVGRCDGTLVWPPRGDIGHGYDPMFMPDGYDQTFGEMTRETKNNWSPGQQGLSHRARAFAKFIEEQIEHG